MIPPTEERQTTRPTVELEAKMYDQHPTDNDVMTTPVRAEPMYGRKVAKVCPEVYAISDEEIIACTRRMADRYLEPQRHGPLITPEDETRDIYSSQGAIPLIIHAKDEIIPPSIRDLDTEDRTNRPTPSKDWHVPPVNVQRSMNIWDGPTETINCCVMNHNTSPDRLCNVEVSERCSYCNIEGATLKCIHCAERPYCTMACYFEDLNRHAIGCEGTSNIQKGNCDESDAYISHRTAHHGHMELHTKCQCAQTTIIDAMGGSKNEMEQLGQED